MNKKNIILAFLVVMLLIAFGSTFAYFVMEITGTGTNPSKVTTGSLDISLTDSSVNISDLSPIHDLDYKQYAYKKEFELVNKGTLNGCSEIYLNITNMSEPLKSNYFKYALVTDTENYTGNYTEIDNNKIKLATNTMVESGKAKKYTLYSWISFDENNVNQNDLLGTSLTASLSVESKDCRE